MPCMEIVSQAERQRLADLPRAELESWQISKLSQLIEAIAPHNRLYASRLGSISRPLKSINDLAAIPPIAKEDLIGEDNFAANLTWPRERYVRFHRTSGTRGRPLVVLDTAEDWNWWIATWQFVLDAVGVEAHDRVLFAFSFGPFVGFWSAFEAVAARGALVVPSGGLNTLARLDLIRSSQATVLFSTPSYVLHLAEVAREQKIDPASLGLRRIVVAGEPGGSVPSLRKRIESTWQAELIDHAGATEVGPWGYSDRERQGLIVNESEFIAEFRSLDRGEPAHDGELAEMMLTTLGRAGCPTIRYRTGDLVRPRFPASGRGFVLLEGGVLGRVDDMFVVRGVNVFPSSIEQILRGFAEVAEYRMILFRQGALDQLAVEVEDELHQPRRIADELELRLGFKVDVREVPHGTLPRFEGKGKRLEDRRGKS